ncbi:hypothetical protein B0T26DRAFT_674420 [Lasiosphaeria miniovina]|uniref:Uncharacterized protein n=1 Tax=Lasiosphaeria miniovina TaxID=1954250 RepID=A0AA40E0S0_9PEZI|nr:uncharacterized protein B0T26DRAFT_674420 [Lasiosphaeria miniovina]KAK0722750.1 hypothetical protein B0T26DRAFT_674420 [Lasiosphaeria miniovina]
MDVLLLTLPRELLAIFLPACVPANCTLHNRPTHKKPVCQSAPCEYPELGSKPITYLSHETTWKEAAAAASSTCRLPLPFVADALAGTWLLRCQIHDQRAPHRKLRRGTLGDPAPLRRRGMMRCAETK